MANTVHRMEIIIHALIFLLRIQVHGVLVICNTETSLKQLTLLAEQSLLKKNKLKVAIVVYKPITQTLAIT